MILSFFGGVFQYRDPESANAQMPLPGLTMLFLGSM